MRNTFLQDGVKRKIAQLIRIYYLTLCKYLKQILIHFVSFCVKKEQNFAPFALI